MLRIAASWRCGGRLGQGFRVTGVWRCRMVRLVVVRLVMRMVLGRGQEPVQPHPVLLGQVSQLVQLLLNFGQASQGLSQQGRETGHVHLAVAVRRRSIADAGGTSSFRSGLFGPASRSALDDGALLRPVAVAHLATVWAQLGAPAPGSRTQWRRAGLGRRRRWLGRDTCRLCKEQRRDEDTQSDTTCPWLHLEIAMTGSRGSGLFVSFALKSADYIAASRTVRL